MASSFAGAIVRRQAFLRFVATSTTFRCMNDGLCNVLLQRRLEWERIIVSHRSPLLDQNRRTQQVLGQQQSADSRDRRIDFQTLAGIDTQPNLPVE
jgi:hypothetical protein